MSAEERFRPDHPWLDRYHDAIAHGATMSGAIHAANDPPDDLLYDAWCVIANASNWLDDPDGEWVQAAIRWRDRFHETLP